MMKATFWAGGNKCIQTGKMLHLLAGRFSLGCSRSVYLCDKLCRPADTEARWRLRSASSTSLDVRRTRLSTVGDRVFPVAAARLWNSLPSHITAAPLSPSSAVVLNHISSHFLIPLSNSPLICVVPAQWLIILDINCYYNNITICPVIWSVIILLHTICQRASVVTNTTLKYSNISPNTAVKLSI